MLIVGTFTLLSVAGLFLTGGSIRRLTGPPPHHNEGVDAYIHFAVLLYGLIAGLVAVAAWEQRSAVDDKVSQEASSLAALYRDVRTYPQPWGRKLTGELRITRSTSSTSHGRNNAKASSRRWACDTSTG